MKVSELTGENLDYWVARAEGLIETTDCNGNKKWTTGQGSGCFAFNPSADWAQGGPIIERELIQFEWFGMWFSSMNMTGKTMLIAGMRAYVASKYGETVPDEVKK